MHTETKQHAGRDFPEDFCWGTATAAYQIEGGVHEAGRGTSIWDRFAHTPGKVRGGDNGDVACDSYHRFREDIDLIKRMGLGSYRYSISWPRIQADGSGPGLVAGLDYYRRLTDAVLEAGLRPLVTLFHWDLPQPLEDAGGWANRETAERFGEYAAIVAAALSDRVRHWIVLNEPKTFTQAGYWQGVHAPGRREPAAFLKATHTANLAQGHGFRALKAARADAEVSSAFDVAAMYPKSDRVEDLAAAQRWHRFLNLWFVQPALSGRYPQGVLPEDQLDRLLGVRAGDDALVRAPLDFIGLNYYSPWLVEHDSQATDIPGLAARAEWARAPGTPKQTDIGWDIHAPGLHEILLDMSEATQGLPIEITECGAAYHEGPDSQGRIPDHARIDYLRQHLAAVAQAMRQGVPVRAFHYWSLLDNFEWAEGYSQRFGLVHVDFDDAQRRRLKESAHWYAAVAASGRLS